MLKVKKQKTDYRMVAKANSHGEIWVYGIIGDDFFYEGVTAEKFRKDLRGLGQVKTIDLHIQSEGGDVTDAQAMYNLLVEHKARVTAYIDGIAASAASFLAMSADEIKIGAGSFFMIHNARSGCRGEAKDMRKMADLLDKVGDTIVAKYVARTGNEEAKVRKWMNEETWFTGAEAVANKFADVLVEDKKVTASINDPSIYNRLPVALQPNRLRAMTALAKLRAAA